MERGLPDGSVLQTGAETVPRSSRRSDARGLTDYVVSAVALNFQTPGEQMDLNQGRFLPNGRCGYVLKPGFLCSLSSNFNPENTGGGPGHIPTQLTIRVSVHTGKDDRALFILIKAPSGVLFLTSPHCGRASQISHAPWRPLA